MKSFQQYLKEKMKDPKYKNHYNDLEPEFAVIESIIQKRLQKVSNAFGAKFNVFII